MKESKNEEIIAYIKFYSEIKKVILTPTFEELKKKICSVIQINQELFSSLKLSYKDEENDTIEVSTDEDYDILLAQIKNKEVDILNIEIEEDANIDIQACSNSIIKFHEKLDNEEDENKKKNNNLDIISSQQFEINKEENKNSIKNNVIESIQSNRITINENNNNQIKKNNLSIQNNNIDKNNLMSPYTQNNINVNNLNRNNLNNINNSNNNKFNMNNYKNNINNNINKMNNFNNNNMNYINNINNFNNINNNNNLNNQTYMVFPYNCSLCNQFPIVKFLFYCMSCNTFLCEDCEEKLGINHRHSLIKVQNKQQFDDLNLKINLRPKEQIIQINNNNNNNNIINNNNNSQSEFTNMLNNIKDSFLGGFFGNDKKTENNNIYQGIQNNQQINPQRMNLIQIARAKYDLRGINDYQLQEAINKTNGNIEEAIALLVL